MRLVKLIEMFLLACIVSMFVFPIRFSFLPGSLNTKMILGLVGIFAYVAHGIQTREARFRKTTVVSLLFAIVFSVWCCFAMVANGTPDDSYATYFMSFAVWLGAAYAVCSFIRLRHGRLNLALVVQYLAVVCVAQCLLALIMEYYPAFRTIVDRYVEQDQDFYHEVRRLYGIGAALDPAGCRFSAVLLLVAHMVSSDERVSENSFQLVLALSSFFLVTLVGSMISRTTLAGAILGLAYMFLKIGMTRNGVLSKRKIRFYSVFLAILAVFIAYSIIRYAIDFTFMDNVRFAFEPFFNYFEHGEFRSDSTDKLRYTMWIWPTNLHDWLIGTGWFGFFVYSTDVGYCRFILYCGLIGFSLFLLFFLYNATVVWRKFKNFKLMTLLLIALMLIIWVKVSTDIFWVYALLFCLPDDGAEEDIVEPEG